MNNNNDNYIAYNNGTGDIIQCSHIIRRRVIDIDIDDGNMADAGEDGGEKQNEIILESKEKKSVCCGVL